MAFGNSPNVALNQYLAQQYNLDESTFDGQGGFYRAMEQRGVAPEHYNQVIQGFTRNYDPQTGAVRADRANIIGGEAEPVGARPDLLGEQAPIDRNPAGYVGGQTPSGYPSAMGQQFQGGLLGDLTPIQTGITGLETGQQGLMAGQQNIQTGITGLETGQQGLQTGITGLETGQQGLQTGITGLETGQQGLMTGQENIQTGITGLETGQQGILGGQQALGAGQGAIQGAIGAPAEGQPQTLFAGQAGLMGGQQALGQQLTGGIQDITGAVGGVSQNIDALERAAEQYQREAQRQRAQMQTAGLAGREQISRQVADVGQQVNTGVEQQRAGMAGQPYQIPQMGMMGPTSAAGVQQAAAQYAQTAQRFTPPAQGQQTVMGPMGPMTVDPRDQFTQPVSTSGLMNYPV